MERNKIFNYDGSTVIITNLEAVLDTFEDKELESIYKLNKYYHELNLELNELVELGYIEEQSGLKYEPEDYLITIKFIEAYIVREYGPNKVKIWESEIDYDFRKNKPKNLKKR